jgi:hypothetical protein
MPASAVRKKNEVNRSGEIYRADRALAPEFLKEEYWFGIAR